uniref:Transmembrane protein 79 n=1 Tax=Leptobrachium leishanense TaxID=445787 RepID=A0A8C5PJC4_9ANUR
MVGPESFQKPQNVNKDTLKSVEGAEGHTELSMDSDQTNATGLVAELPIPKPRSRSLMQDDPMLADQPSEVLETPELQKKPKTVGFADADEVIVSKPNGGEELSKEVDLIDMDNELAPPQKDVHLPNGSEENKVENPFFEDQGNKTESGGQMVPLVDLSTALQRKISAPSCLCKECVQNCGICTHNGQQSEEEEEDKDIDSLQNDADSESSSMDKSRSGSERSRRSNSSEGENVGSKYEDTQTTLPYPDPSRPPDSITRLSNAGLYEPKEESMKKSEMDNHEEKQDVGPQIAYPTICVQSQVYNECSEIPNHEEFRESCVKLDIEKGEPEKMYLLHNHHSRDESVYNTTDCYTCKSSCVKMLVSFLISLLFFPAFLFVTYKWLPFDTPKMPDIPTRLVYTLRCGAFASFPIVLGVVVHGIARLCVSSFDPFKAPEREVKIHRRFVKQSVLLFVLYFFNLSVLATYLPQHYLKCIPLLTGLFALAQLIYWLSFAVGRSFRGFGYGLTFLPMLVMLFCNLYFMFIVEPEKMVFFGTPKEGSSLGQNR